MIKKEKVLAFLLAVTALLCASCSDEDKIYEPVTKVGDLSFEETNEVTDYIKIQMEDGSAIIIELYPDIAPATVANIQKLVKKKFYDGLTFHRVIKNFIIQTGDPKANGTGGSDETVHGEFSSNGFENNLSHKRGVVSMARKKNDKNSASSQFFICQVDYPYLDGDYAALGKVIAGMDTVDKIASVKVNSDDKPIEDQVIATIRFIVLETEQTTQTEQTTRAEQTTQQQTQTAQ